MACRLNPELFTTASGGIPRIEIAQAAQAMLAEVDSMSALRSRKLNQPEYGQTGTRPNYITMHPIGNDFMDAASFPDLRNM